MNLKDGRVRARVEGPRPVIEKFIQELGKGPPLSLRRATLRPLAPGLGPLRGIRNPLRGVRVNDLGRHVPRQAPRDRHARAAGGAGAALAFTEPVAGPRTPQRVYEVKPGDTLTSLAKQYGVSVATLVKLNKLPSVNAQSKVGQHLVIPRLGRARDDRAPSAARLTRAGARRHAPSPPRTLRRPPGLRWRCPTSTARCAAARRGPPKARWSRPSAIAGAAGTAGSTSRRRSGHPCRPPPPVSSSHPGRRDARTASW